MSLLFIVIQELTEKIAADQAEMSKAAQQEILCTTVSANPPPLGKSGDTRKNTRRYPIKFSGI
jgi:hypothetical protein